MRLLRVPPEYADKLKEVKRFYTLTPEIPAPRNVNSLEVWLLIGSPAEQSKRSPKHASLTMNAIFRDDSLKLYPRRPRLRGFEIGFDIPRYS